MGEVDRKHTESDGWVTQRMLEQLGVASVAGMQAHGGPPAEALPVTDDADGEQEIRSQEI